MKFLKVEESYLMAMIEKVATMQEEISSLRDENYRINNLAGDLEDYNKHLVKRHKTDCDHIETLRHANKRLTITNKSNNLLIASLNDKYKSVKGYKSLYNSIKHKIAIIESQPEPASCKIIKITDSLEQMGVEKYA